MQSRFFKASWKFLDILFPPCCAGCGEWGERYCRTCLNNTRTINSDICKTCGEPLNRAVSSVCVRCKSTDIYFSAIRSWALFEDPLKRAIHNLKYNRNIGLGEVLAEPLAILFSACEWQVDLISAVPLDRDRKRERGFNQSILLARPLSWITKIPLKENAITRTRITGSQVGLSREERIENMDNAFNAAPGIVSGKNILIIDDVITTGSTINACSKAIIESGANRVFGLTVARSAQL